MKTNRLLPFIHFFHIIIFSCFSILLQAQLPSCIEVIDQEQIQMSYDARTFGGAAQSITIDQTGFLSKIEARVTPRSTVTLRIFTGDLLSPTLVYTQIYELGESNLPFDWYTWELNEAFSVVKGQSYIISLGGIDYWGLTERDVYPGGESSIRGDFVFRTYVCKLDLDNDGVLDEQDNCSNLSNIGLDLDGIDDYVSIPNNESLDFSNSFTLEAWINKRQLGDERILDKGQAGRASGFTFDTHANKLRFITAAGNISGTTTLSTNEWYHVAAVFDKEEGKVRLFLNGEVDGELAINRSIISNTYPLNIGKPGEGDADRGTYNGIIDNVRIWLVARTQEELQLNQNQELRASQPNLIVNFTFNEGLANTDNSALEVVKDWSGNGNDGQLINISRTGTGSNWTTGAPINFPDPDGDGQGDACDICPDEVNIDTDGDSVLDCLDICPGQDDNLDSDGDGRVDCLDNCPNTPNTGLAFDGIDDYIDLGANIYFGSEYTVECWFKHPKVTGEHDLLAVNANNILLELGANGAIRFLHRVPEGVTGGTNIFSAPNYDDNQWHHVAAVKTASEMFLYIDGELEASAADATSINDLVHVVIGKISYLGAARFFNGSMDEYRIWNTARSQSEIQNNMQFELANFLPDLVANYSFNEGLPSQNNTGLPNTLEDNSRNKNAGILSGFAQNGTTSNWGMGAPINFVDNDNDGIGYTCDSDEIAPYFYASQKENDAFVEISWDIDLDCLGGSTNQPYSILIKADGRPIDDPILVTPTTNGLETKGKYIHEVGPDQEITYTLEVFKSTSSIPSCSSEQLGSTLPFQEPTILSISKEEFPDKVVLEWQNNSKLSDQFLILRDGIKIGELLGNQEVETSWSFIDNYLIEDIDKRFTNGQSYDYCIVTKNDLVESLPPVCVAGSTLPINFTASDNTNNTQVELTWDDVSSFCDQLQILRDGEEIALLLNNNTSYTDRSPINGKESEYGIVLLKNGIELVAAYDQGQVAANGQISGKVLTTDGLFPIKGVNVQLEGEVGAQTISGSTTTDLAGVFNFSNLFYGAIDTFTIEVIPSATQKFEKTTVEVELSSLQPKVLDLLFLENTGYQTGENLPNLISFLATPDPTKDKVDLAWNYEPNTSNITYFNLFRGSTLIAQLNDAGTNDQSTFTFEDLDGVPNTTYDYRIAAYYIEEAVLSQSTLTKEATFPEVTVPTSIIASLDEDLGLIEINWTHSSENFEEFRLYRNDVLIASTSNTSFSDLNATSNANDLIYTITAYRSIEQADFESDGRNTVAINYPSLPIVTDLVANPLEGQDQVNLEWTVPAELVQAYNYDGVRLYRMEADGTTELILEKDKNFLVPQTTVSFKDKTGKPKETYTYELRTYLSDLEEVGNAASANFPSVSVPLTGTSSSGTGKVRLDWQSPHTSDNYDGFIIYRDAAEASDSIGEINFQYENTYTDYSANSSSSVNINYFVRTIRRVEGQEYLSDPLKIEAAPPTIDAEAQIALPTNFKASTGIGNHIKLSWKTFINPFSQAQFEIRREGALIATLDRQVLDYYDYDAPIGRSVEYSLRIIDGNARSPEVFTAGKILGTKSITGRVYKKESQQGVANVEITIKNIGGSPVLQKVKTDASGYYSVPILAATADYQLELTASAENSDFLVNPQQLNIVTEQEKFNLNFIDVFEKPTSPSIAEITYISAQPDPVNSIVTLSWSPDNGIYDGFEIFRGTNFLGETLRGEELLFADETGRKGNTEIYRVRAFIYVGEDKKYASFSTTLVTFPALLPVENLNVTPYFEEIQDLNDLLTSEENSVRVQWSHPYDNMDYYQIDRNGEDFARVESGEQLEITDHTGVPEQLYQYTITAVKGDLQSPAKTISTYYPKIQKVRNFQSYALMDGENTRNHQLMSWEYEASAADYFEVYRDGKILAKLRGDERSYKDYEGRPEVDYTYSIAAIVNRNELEYVSDTVLKAVRYPKLAFPTNRKAVAEVGTGLLKLTFDYLHPGAQQFKIYRDDVLLETIFDDTYGADAGKVFLDRNGVPDRTYNYKIEAIAIIDGVTYVSDRKAFNSIKYPKIPNPPTFTASDNASYNAITLRWSYNKDLRVDQFEISRKLPNESSYSLLTRLDGGQRNYTDLFNSSTPTGSVAYKIVANRANFASIGVTDNGSAGILGDGYEGTQVIHLSANTPQTLFYPPSVAIDGNTAIFGNPSRRNNNGEWVGDVTRVSKIGPSNWGNANEILGEKNFDVIGTGVAIDGNATIVGARNNKVYLNPWSDFSNEYSHETIFRSSNSDFAQEIDLSDFEVLGYDVDRSLFDKILGSANGKAAIITSSYLGLEAAYVFSGGELFGRSVTINDFVAAVGERGTAVHTYRFFRAAPLSWPEWLYNEVLNSPEGASQFGSAIDLSSNSKNYLIVGASAYDEDNNFANEGGGSAYIYTYNRTNSTWSSPFKVIPISEDERNQFGESVSITSSGYAVVGAPREQVDGLNNAGAVYIYKKEGNTWRYYTKITAETPVADSQFGINVDADEQQLIVASRNTSIHIYKFDEVKNPRPATRITATKGAEITSITWDWDYTNVEIDEITGFRLYRDGTLIKTITNGLSTEDNQTNDDQNPIPGKQYTYQIKAYTSDGGESNPIAAIGYNKADGIIKGRVLTQIGRAGVPNIMVTAKATIEGEIYTYTEKSGADGRFTFEEVYYGSGSADYSFTPSFDGHEFEEVAPLSVSNVSNREVEILDKTAYVVQGIVQHEDVENCIIEGVEVRAVHIVKGREDVVRPGESIKTDENGAFNLIIRPTEKDLDTIRIEIADRQYLGEVPNQDTIFYEFKMLDQSKFNRFDDDFQNFPIVTKLDIRDTKRYQVDIKLQNACENPISDAKFKLRIRSLDGCYEDFFELARSGERTLKLPPQNVIISVEDVASEEASDLVALEFLKNNPVTVDLYDLHRDSVRILNEAEQNAKNARTITYHKAPIISLAPDSFEEYLCDLPTQPAVVQQGENYEFSLTIGECFEQEGCSIEDLCPVKEGFVVITNAAAASSVPDTIYPNPITGEIPRYTFTGGNPNLVEPHTWAIQIEYFSEAGSFLGSMVQAVVVEGEVAVPGSDIIVDPMNGENVVPLPLFVLRDPPGDGSFSTLSKGQTFNQSYSFEGNAAASAGIYTDNSFSIGGIGAKLSVASNIGTSLADERTLEFEITTNETFTTSPSQSGRVADLIVGTGMALQYGMIQQIEVVDCGIVERTKTGFSPNSLQTTWVYSIERIENIIAEYEAALPEIVSGIRPIFRSDGSPYTPEDAVKLYGSWIANWQQVLRYHEFETNPIYVLCNQDYTENREGAKTASHETLLEANKWRDGFCKIVGASPGENFVLNDDIQFFQGENGDFRPLDAELLTQYNNTATAVLNLTNPLQEEVDRWSYSERNRDTPGFAEMTDTELGGITLVGGMANNYTFDGGGSGIEYSASNTQTSSKGFTQSTFIDASIGGAITGEVGFESFLGLGGGIITKAVEVNLEVGVVASTEISITENRTTTVANEASSAFFLSDSDPGDQYSVTVLKSLAPNHTPYFQLFGGRTSCPPEEGAIARDVPMIQVATADGAAKSDKRFFVAPDEAAEFTLILNNTNAFEEDRNLILFVVPGSNPDGAKIEFDGEIIGESMPFDPSDNPNPKLFISRGRTAFNYSQIKIGVKPACEEDDANVDYISLDVSFQTPCSPVSIVTPNNNWLLNSVNSKLRITIRDYQVDNPVFESLQLEYRHLNGENEWREISSSYLRGTNSMNPVSKEVLAVHNSTLFATPGSIPEYFFTWELPSSLDIFPDGEYELRVVATCKEGLITSETYSNTISGKIDRNGLRLFGRPKPANGIWTTDDEISATFNKNLNCPLMSSSKHQDEYFSAAANGVNIEEVQFECKNSQIILDIPNISQYDGQQISVTLDSVVGLNGNIARDITWSFRVASKELYWSQDTLKVQLYEDQDATYELLLQNTKLLPGVTFELINFGDSDAWLDYTPNSNFTIAGFDGQKVRLNLSSSDLATGNYTEALDVRLLGGTETLTMLHIMMEVLPLPPYEDLIAEEEQFEHSMRLIANYQYLGEEVSSIDTMDQISVWLEGELRGKARIQRIGNFYAAYLDIFGNETDINKALEFQVWDASINKIQLAQAQPSAITYQKNVSIGTTANPEIVYIGETGELINEEVEVVGEVVFPETEVNRDFGLKVFPNPSSSSTNMNFVLDAPQKVSISIMDIAASNVTLLKEQDYVEGKHQLVLDFSSYEAGVYLLNFQTNDLQISKKFVLIK